MKNKLSIMLVVKVLLLAVLVGAIYMAATGNFSQKSCSLSHDECLIKEMESQRGERDAWVQGKEEALDMYVQAARKEIDEYKFNKNTTIEGYKLQLNADTVGKELQAGRKENVPAKILQFVVPQAEADSRPEDVSLGVSNDTTPQVTPAGYKLREFLKTKNAPFADVNFPALATETRVTQDEMFILLAITGKESNWGTTYTSTRGGVRRSEPVLGLEYHNATGLKNPKEILPGCPANSSIPDSNGMWLQRYESWEQYFSCYFRQIRRGYFERGLDTPAEMSTIYLTGDKGKWASDVIHFKSQIEDAVK